MTALARPSLPDWPRLMSVERAAQYLSISESSLRVDGPQPRRYGRRVLYDRHDLDRWADRLAGQPLTAQEQIEEAADVERRFLAKRRA